MILSRRAERSNKWTLLGNSMANCLGVATQLVVTFLLAPLIVHGLGDQRYGVWSLVESIIAYMTLLDLGIAASVVKYTARFEENGEGDRLDRVASTSFAMFGCAGL